MAAVSAWAKPGSWALAAEEQDDLPPPPPPVPVSDFPDLATAATTKVPKKKKAQPVSLATFNSAKFVPSSSRGPTPDMLMSLPTGPRERTDEELDSARNARWGRTEEPRRGGSGPDEYGPSRADEADDWTGSKKPLERRDRMGGFGGDSMSSRADDVDNWASTKKTAPAPLPDRRERSVAFGGDSQGRADDSASWVSNKSYSAAPPQPSDGRRGGSVWGFNRDGGLDADSWARKRDDVTSGGVTSGARPRLVLHKRTMPVAVGTDEEKEEDKEGELRPKSRSSNPFGTARPRDEVVAAKGETLTEVDKEEEKLVIQPKTRNLNPFGAARPREEVLAAKGESLTEEDKEAEKLVIQPKIRNLNPFGAARPREEVLAAKGEDWRKIDEKLEAMKVREAPPERRSIGRRVSPASEEENGNGHVPESHAENAWKKPLAVESARDSEEGSETIKETVPAN